MIEKNTPAMPGSQRLGPLAALLKLFSSVWFGIFLMVLIFIYLTIGSAGLAYPTGLNIFSSNNWAYMLVRRHPLIDKTEMEFFSWWPFTLLIGLFVLNMVVVTVRRIPLTLLNAGVWTIHTGIVILALGSIYYFSTKLEGDTPVFRRNIVVEAPGAAPKKLIVRTGAEAQLDTPSGPYTFRVQSIQPDWPILSGADKGKRAYSVNVAVQTPTQQFIRQMLVDYPQYTEDIIPGQGRAVKSTGKKLLDDQIKLSFAYEPQQYFYLKDTAAVYVREVGTQKWFERPIKGLPHYSDHIAARDEIWQPAGDPVIEPNPLNILVPRYAPDDPFKDVQLRVTGRLLYSPSNEMRWVPGGTQLNPIAGVRLEDHGRVDHSQLIAFDPAGRQMQDGLIEFHWAESAEALTELESAVGNHLQITIPETGGTLTVPTLVTHADDPSLQYAPIGDSGWSYRIEKLYHNLSLPGDNGLVSVAVVNFKSSDRSITRWVADVPERTRDVQSEHNMQPPDPVIDARYQAGPMIIIAAGPKPIGLHLIAEGSGMLGSPLEVGQPLELGQGVKLTVTHLYTNSHREIRPAVVPRRERRPNAGEQLSRIKLVIRDGDWAETDWLPFHLYPFPSEQYEASRRFMYQPTRVTLPDGRQIELLFSRKRAALPAAVALEDFQLATHVGGYVPGQTTSIRDFTSRLRTYQNGAWGKTFTASLNQPASDHGMYYFQSEWDPGELCYTGLGVGNRNGVHIQLFGVCMSVAGMIFVFYVKPIIKRRRRLAVLSTLAEVKANATSEREPERAAVGSSS